jgi:hypothetical protein
MSNTIQTGCPYKAVAGDTVQFYVQNTNYPASLYTLQLSLFATGVDPDLFNGVAQPDGSFLISLTPSQTETVLPEKYTAVYVYTSIATPATRNSIRGGVIWIIPDLTTQTTPSANQVLLTQLEATMLKLAQGSISSATINQQTWTKKNMQQLREQILFTTSQVKKELEQLNTLLGNPDTTQTSIEFKYQGGYPSYTWPFYNGERQC